MPKINEYLWGINKPQDFTMLHVGHTVIQSPEKVYVAIFDTRLPEDTQTIACTLTPEEVHQLIADLEEALASS